MIVNSTMSGVGAAARQRATMLVRDAIAKREASLASTQARKLSINQADGMRSPSSQGGK